MTDTALSEASDTGVLIDHILSRYHAIHRVELKELHPLAERVERVHADDPQVPKGLSKALMILWRDMEDHMKKEEHILFPAMRSGGTPGLERPIAVMRSDHDDHGETISMIRRLTVDISVPDHACGSWRSLYAGIAKLLADLETHIALENDILFPRFENR